MSIFNRFSTLIIIIFISSAGGDFILCGLPAHAISSQIPSGSQNSAGAGTHSPDVENESAGAANNELDSTTINKSGSTPSNPPGGQSVKSKKKPSQPQVVATPGKKFKFSFSAKTLVTVPARAVKATPGLLIGTPIAITRKVVDESKQATFDLAGDNRNPVVLSVLGFFLGVPAGVLTGSTEAPVIAGINGWKYADQKPFSKEYFSLGEKEPPPMSQ